MLNQLWVHRVRRRMASSDLPLVVELWNGQQVGRGDGAAVRVRLRQAASLKAMADPSLGALARALPDQEVSVDCGIATLSIVGHGICAVPGVASRVMTSIAALGIEPEVVASSGTSITVVLPKSRLEEAARALHADLGLGRATRDEAP